MVLKLGDTLGDLTFLHPDGASVALSTFLGRPLMLIFLRHLG